MNQHQTMPSLIEYLDQNGVLELGDELAIKAAKKAYRKSYQRAYKRHQRSQRKEYHVQLSKEENKLICEAAKKHHLSPSKFIKKAALAYLQKEYIVPDNERIAQLEYLLSIAYSSVNQIAGKTPQLSHDYERLSQIIEQLEREVTQALRYPPSLEMLIVKTVKNNPDFRKILAHILNSTAPYDNQN